MATNAVLFKFGNQDAYDALKTKESNALYFIEDKHRLYKGDVLMSDRYVIVADNVPQPSDAEAGRIYVVTNDENVSLYIKSGNKMLPISGNGGVEIGSVDMDSFNPDIIATEIGDSSGEGDPKLVTDKVVKEYVETVKGELEKELEKYDDAFVNVEVGESSDEDDNKIGLHFTKANGEEVVIDLDKEKFLESATLKNDGKTLVLVMTNGDEVEVNFADMLADAETVKTTSKIKLTTGWGNLPVGYEIDSETSLQQLLLDALSKDIDPVATLPTAKITLSNSGAKEVGTNITPSYSITFTDGKYSVTTDKDSPVSAGCTATTYHVTDTNSGTNDAKSGSMKSFQVTDGMSSYSVTATVDYSAGNDAYSYLGVKKDNVTIKSGTTQASTSSTITGFRGKFWGQKLEGATLTAGPDNITGEQVRALGSGAIQTIPSSVTLNKGCQEVFFAVPAGTYSASASLKVLNSANQAPFGDGQKVTNVQVEGAENYTAIAYDVYYIHNGGGAPDTATYTVSIS